jgi:hypothetical protein
MSKPSSSRRRRAKRAARKKQDSQLAFSFPPEPWSWAPPGACSQAPPEYLEGSSLQDLSPLWGPGGPLEHVPFPFGDKLPR